MNRKIEIDTESLSQEIIKLLDIVDMGCVDATICVATIDGKQIQIKVTVDEDDFLDDDFELMRLKDL